MFNSKFGSDSFTVLTGINTGHFLVQLFNAKNFVIKANSLQEAIRMASEKYGAACYLLSEVKESKNGIATLTEQVYEF